jgi:N-acetylmuramoyl-L-alanine amidase
MRKILIIAVFVTGLIPALAFADKTISADEFRCLSHNIYHEARGEPLIGQRAVARVTLNRKDSERFPDDICSVVYQKGQFSWTTKNPRIKNSDAFATSRAISILAVVNYNLEADDPTNGSLFFHSTHINPGWKRKKSVRIGNHVFYY